MNEYHKIQSVFLRDKDTNRLIDGAWTMPEFAFLADLAWEFTEKVDGTNIRVMFDGSKFTFGGRTDNAQIPAKLFERLNDRFRPLEAKAADVFPKGVTFYGEGYGPGIQKGGGNYRSDQDFVMFDVRVFQWWLKRADVESIGDQFGIEVVPVIGVGSLHRAIDMARNGIKSVWGNYGSDFAAEGIVARPAVELCTRSGERIIAKVKCRDFKENR